MLVFPCAWARGWLKTVGPRCRTPRRMVDELLSTTRRARRCGPIGPLKRRVAVHSDATPGQAGPPAEFKHINKRRKRNIHGFP